MCILFIAYLIPIYNSSRKPTRLLVFRLIFLWLDIQRQLKSIVDIFANNRLPLQPPFVAGWLLLLRQIDFEFSSMFMVK